MSPTRPPKSAPRKSAAGSKPAARPAKAWPAAATSMRVSISNFRNRRLSIASRTVKSPPDT